VSGFSHEFGSVHYAVENEIKMKSSFAKNQPGFHPDFRMVEVIQHRGRVRRKFIFTSDMSFGEGQA
jgi:hypothetical protein